MICLYELNQSDDVQSRQDESIICVGDSLTGWNPKPINEWRPVYPLCLENMLPEKKETANFGVADAESSKCLELVSSADSFFPDAQYYIICLGGSDIGYLANGAQTPEEVITNLSKGIDYLLERDKHILLMNIPKVNAFYFSDQDELERLMSDRKTLNQRISRLAEEREVGLVDIFSVIKDKHLGDEVHPNLAGAELIAKVAHARLKLAK